MDTSRVLRTPEVRFADLPDYPFAPHYLKIDGLRMHYLDEGPKQGNIVLMLHGEPSWSYLYRKVIGPVTAAGYRVIAPDLIGFGRSDKLVRQRDYSAGFHVASIQTLIDALSLDGITLLCQDWGGLIGLRVAMAEQARFRGLSPPIPCCRDFRDATPTWPAALPTGICCGRQPASARGSPSPSSIRSGKPATWCASGPPVA